MAQTRRCTCRRVKDIWQRYLKKFSKHGKLLENDAGLEIDEAAVDLDTYTDTVSPVRTLTLQ